MSTSAARRRAEVTPPPDPARIDDIPELEGWRWRTQRIRATPTGDLADHHCLSGPDGWETKLYQKPTKAIAEALRRVRSRPKQKAPEGAPLPAVPDDLPGWEWERDSRFGVRLVLPTDGLRTPYGDEDDLEQVIADARARVAADAALAAEETPIRKGAALQLSTTAPAAENWRELPPAQIRRDGGTQARTGNNEDVVEEYTAAMREGRWRWHEGNRLVVFFDGSHYWLADGFHRTEAAQRADLVSVPCEVRAGSQRDAVLYAVGANADHGLRRTRDDVRRAIRTLLLDEEWRSWSNAEIARRARTTDKTVATVRGEMESGSEIPRVIERVGADGKVYGATRRYIPQPETPDDLQAAGFLLIRSSQKPGQVKLLERGQAATYYATAPAAAAAARERIRGRQTPAPPLPSRPPHPPCAHCGATARELMGNVCTGCYLLHEAQKWEDGSEDARWRLSLARQDAERDADPARRARRLDEIDLIARRKGFASLDSPAPRVRPEGAPSEAEYMTAVASFRMHGYDLSCSARADGQRGCPPYWLVSPLGMPQKHPSWDRIAAELDRLEAPPQRHQAPEPAPILRVTDSGLFQVAEESSSLMLFTEKKRIKKPFPYDGRLWVAMGGHFGGGKPSMNECVAVVPAGTPYAPGEKNPGLRDGAYTGERASYGGQEWELTGQWLFVSDRLPGAAPAALPTIAPADSELDDLIADLTAIEGRIAAGIAGDDDRQALDRIEARCHAIGAYNAGLHADNQRRSMGVGVSSAPPRAELPHGWAWRDDIPANPNDPRPLFQARRAADGHTARASFDQAEAAQNAAWSEGRNPLPAPGPAPVSEELRAPNPPEYTEWVDRAHAVGCGLSRDGEGYLLIEPDGTRSRYPYWLGAMGRVRHFEMSATPAPTVEDEESDAIPADSRPIYALAERALVDELQAASPRLRRLLRLIWATAAVSDEPLSDDELWDELTGALIAAGDAELHWALHGEAAPAEADGQYPAGLDYLTADLLCAELDLRNRGRAPAAGDVARWQDALDALADELDDTAYERVAHRIGELRRSAA